MKLNTAKKSTRKGITAVVAVVLLLMMTVAAAGLAYMWISGMQAETQAKTNAQVETQQEQMLGALSIESVWQNGAGFSMAVRNVGSSTFTYADTDEFKVYTDGVIVDGGNIIETGGPTTSLAPGESITLTASTPALPAAGVKMQIKIIAPNGVEASHTCKIPTTGATYC